MNEEKKNETELGNSILAILAGAAATFLTGLILFPLVQFMADQFWEFDFSGRKKGMSVNDIVIGGTLLIWVFVSALPGGFTSSLICRSYDYTHAFVLTGICMLIVLFMGGSTERTSDLVVALIGLAVACAGFLTGTRINVMRKKRRKDKQSLDL